MAAFSLLCETQNISPEVQLFGMNSVLEAFRRCGPMMLFGSIADEPLDEREAEFQAAASSQAERNFMLRKRRTT
jgi:hypothetical protein